MACSAQDMRGSPWSTSTWMRWSPVVRTRTRLGGLTGWLSATAAPLYGERRLKFEAAMNQEPLQNLNHSVLDGQLLRDILADGMCDEFCASIYDAMWTAAIATSRSAVGEDGAIDKTELLAAIRNVSFEGATGQVEYDTDGERRSTNVPLLIKNLRPQSGSNSSHALVSVPTWRLQSGLFVQVSGSPPVWPGGEEAWQLPVEILDCARGFVFSLSSLQCEPCPRGTVQEGTACVRFDASVGVLVPLHWSDAKAVGWATRHAASAAMAAHHINHRTTTLVPRAKELLPEGFKLVVDIQDSLGLPSVAVDHVVQWNEQGSHAIVGPYQSAVAGPAALAASIEGTPIISYSGTASALSERSTYPTLSRTVLADSVLAIKLIGSFQALGWNRIAILYAREAWGRGLAQDVTSAASRSGVEVVSVADFSAESEIDGAVAAIESSQARIVACFVESAHVAAVAAAAVAYGMLNKGFVWVLALEHGINEAISASAEPDKTRDRLTGWFIAGFDELFGGRRQRFQTALENAPQATVAGTELEGVFNAGCDRFCGTIYDAVWVAAIGISRANVSSAGSEGGEPPRADTLRSIRNVSFEGATGWVRLDEDSGERVLHADDSPVLFKNLRANSRREWMPTLSAEPTWMWTMHDDGSGQLVALGTSPPVWPGGEEDWAPPPDRVVCVAGFVFDSRMLSCEPCPPGTAQQGRECVACHPGQFAAQEGTTQCLPCASVGYANESRMDACHRCPSNKKMNTSVLNATSMDQCVCADGFVDAACTLHDWQVMIIALVVVGVPAVGLCVQRVCWFTQSLDDEAVRIEQQMALIRAKLRIRREDGFLLSGESRTWFQTLRFADTTLLPAKYLENTARLSLMLPFEGEAVDLLAAQLHIHRDTRDESDEETSVLGRLPSRARHLSWTARVRKRLVMAWRRERQGGSSGQGGGFERYLALCKLVLEVSEWLLDPEHKSPPEENNGNRSLATPRLGFLRFFRRRPTLFSSSPDPKAGLLCPDAQCAADRFEFFKGRVAKLNLWEHDDNFQKLKTRIQVWMDNLRLSTDRLFDAIHNEPGGPALREFQGPWEDHAEGGGREPRREQRGRILRQDHHRVRAVRVDDEAIAEFELQVPDDQGEKSHLPPASSSSLGLSNFQHSLRAPALAVGGVVNASSHSLGSTQSDGVGVRAKSQSWGSLDGTVARHRFDQATNLQGPASPRRRSDCNPGTVRAHRRSLAGIEATVGEAEHVTLKCADGGSSVCVVCDVGLEAELDRGLAALPSPVHQRSEVESEASPCPAAQAKAAALVGEGAFIQQLHLRADLLDAEFQRAVNLCIARAGQEFAAQDIGQAEPEPASSDAADSMEFCAHGVRVVSAPIKTVLRMGEKVKQYAEELQRAERPEQFLPYTAHILDPLRCSVVCRNSTSILQHAKWLIEHGESCGLPVVRAKNKFALQDSSEFDGYRDLMLSVLFTGRKGLRVIGEIQLHDERMYPLKVKMHRLYKVKRATRASTI